MLFGDGAAAKSCSKLANHWAVTRSIALSRELWLTWRFLTVARLARKLAAQNNCGSAGSLPFWQRLRCFVAVCYFTMHFTRRFFKSLSSISRPFMPSIAKGSSTRSDQDQKLPVNTYFAIISYAHALSLGYLTDKLAAPSCSIKVIIQIAR